MYILAIDTSCDDTSAAVSQDAHVLSNIISSQVELHSEFGGVMPDVARREHKARIDEVIQKALKQAGVTIEQIDVFAVTKGPGLAIALGVGIDKAKELAIEYSKPIIGVNHMEGHIYSNFVEPSRTEEIAFPLLALLVSGGHTELVLMKDHGQYQLLGQKLDDAAGEAFDKVARMLGLGYPGGAVLAQMAEEGDENAYKLPVPLTLQKGLDFSFSGLKTAVVRLVSEITSQGARSLTKKEVQDIAASFQRVTVKHLVNQTMRAVEQTGVQQVLLGGGVSANLALRKELRSALKAVNSKLYFPINPKLCMDNAAMIAEVAYYKAMKNEFNDVSSVERAPGLRIA